MKLNSCVALAFTLMVTINHPIFAQCTDLDGDGYFFQVSCGIFKDCNDASPDTHPGAPESCDGYDNDCDSYLDELPCDTTCDSPEGTANLRITFEESDSSAPSVAWTGSDFGVTWSDSRDSNLDIYFARLDASGSKIGEDKRITTHASGYSAVSDLSWTGSDFGCFWDDTRDGVYQVYFALLDASGNKVVDDTNITGTDADAQQISSVWTGSEFGVVWTDDRDGDWEIYFARVSTSGTRIGNAVRVTHLADHSYAPSVAWDGSHYGIAWKQIPTPQNGKWNIDFVRLDALGQPLGPETTVSTAVTNTGGPVLIWNGQQYALVWSDDRDGNKEIYFARVDPFGSKIGTDSRITNHTGVSDNPWLAWTGSEYGVVWNDSRDGDSEVYFALLDAFGSKLGADIRLTNAPADSIAPVIAWTGTRFGVTWYDHRDKNYEIYFAGVGCNCVDQDYDGVSNCNDCDETSVTTYPGAAELCDGIDNNCDGASDEGITETLYRDSDGDGYGTPNDTEQSCNELVGFVAQGGDCNDVDPAVSPVGTEVCNGIDDNCNSQTDEDTQGVDSDGDGRHNACDNCPGVANPSQIDTDGDGVGTSCDNCAFVANPSQADADADGRGDICDNCPADYNTFQDDWDTDRVGDACDNCAFDYNPDQADMDADFEGDYCDLDDGLILIRFYQPEYVEWQEEAGFNAWNSYKGDLAVLRATGVYTQVPGSNPLADRDCGLDHPWSDDFDSPAPGTVAFFLTTGVVGGIESDLGMDSTGAVRPNINPCP